MKRIRILQKLFNDSVYPLIKQGKASISTSGQCAYRGVDCKKCAIGMLISDDVYSIELEDVSVWDWSVMDAIAKSGYEIHKSDDIIQQFLRQLQLAHDNGMVKDMSPDAYWLSGFKRRCKAIAKEYGLECTI
jgi:hypothetical protein